MRFLLILLIAVLSSCEGDSGQNVRNSESAGLSINTPVTRIEGVGVTHYIYTIDECEYIVFIGANGRMSVLHKQNCKNHENSNN